MSTTTPAPPAASSEDDAPVRICRKCSTQSRTSGVFCPQCGARYEKKRRSTKTRLLILGLPLIVLVVAGGVAAALIVNHNDQVATKKRAAAHAAAVQAAARRSAQAEQRRLAADQAKAKRDLARLERLSMVDQLQAAVRKDAEKDVAQGLLTGPILKVQCQPASTVDSTAPIADYTCIAANSDSGGTLSGYRFSGTVDTGTGSITWRLGG